MNIRKGIYRESSYADITKPSTGKITVVRAYQNEDVVFDGRIGKNEALATEWLQVSQNRWISKINPRWKRIDGLWLNRTYVPRVESISKLKQGTWHYSQDSLQATLEVREDNNPNDWNAEFRLRAMIEVDTPYWRIEGIKAQYFNYAGITISTTHHVTIRDCTVSYNGGAGIEADEGADIAIENNVTSFNGIDGGPGWASGIHLWKPIFTHNIVKGNISYKNWDPSDHHTDGNGIAVDNGGPSAGADVFGNTVYQNGGRGIDITKTANVHLQDNLSYENSLDPLMTNQGEVSLSEEISTHGFRMFHNTLRSKGKNPALVLFGNARPSDIEGDWNVLCNSDFPGLVASVYGKIEFQMHDWQQLTNTQKNSTIDCQQDMRRK